MGKTEDLARLAAAVAARASRLLAEGPERSVSDARVSALLDALELFVPKVLSLDFHEWEIESLDGFLVANATNGAEGSVSLAGLAILISDQTVTPFSVALHPGADGSLERAEIRLGERGGGALGISGPICTAASVPSRLNDLLPRLSDVDWVYCATYVRPDSRLRDDS